MKVIPVILAGGVGERFWPMSRQNRPKQLLPIISSKPMIEETMIRARPFCVRGVRPLVVTGKSIAASMRRLLPKSLKYDCIIEPVGKNTAPAIAAAAAWILQHYGDAIMMVLPADHAISTSAQFADAMRSAAALAGNEKKLCVFGIKPSRPDTGYGYIQQGKSLRVSGRTPAFSVRRFVEKPDTAHARRYMSAGGYFWNSGMFVWKSSVILQEIATYMPELSAHVERLMARKITTARMDAFYSAAAKESIDYGVMEKSLRVALVCPSFSWDDVGSWESLERIHGRSAAGNTIVGPAVFHEDCEGSIVVNGAKLTVATCGLKDTVIVVTDDAVMAIARDKLPQIRRYLAAMKADGRLSRSIF